MAAGLSEPELRLLMTASLAGDARAYRHLLESCEARLRPFFRRRLGGAPDEVDDLVQETLIAVHAKRATYDDSQPVTAWIYAIARYKLIDLYRRTGRRRHVPLDDVEGDLVIESESEAVDARQDIERGLAALPPQTRDLVRSVKLNGEPVAAVAARTGMSEGAVKVAVHRGFVRLAALLRGPEKEPEKEPGGPEP